MAVVSRNSNSGLVTPWPSHGLAYDVKQIVDTIEVTGGDSDTSTYLFDKLYLPSRAIILPDSKVRWDDLASTGSPTLDIGLQGDQITNDPDALNDGLDVTAAGWDWLIKDPAVIDLPAWDHVNGQASDPGGRLKIYGSIVDADANTGGTITIVLNYRMP